MDTIDWYYIYSQRYHPFHLYLQDKIPKNTFNAKGIFVDQSVFDEHLYKHSGEHFFSRITVKVETILCILKEKIVDIQAVNRVLNSTHITYSCFSVRDVGSCQTMKTDEPCVYHILCGSISREQDMEDKYFEARRFGVDIDKYIT